jgi:hypothetical protein
VEVDEIFGLSKIKELTDLLGFCINLPKEEHQTLPKMGPKSVQFVDEAQLIVKSNPQMMPGDFEGEEFDKDVDLHKALRPIHLALGNLFELVDDTYFEVGSEAYVAALEVYRIAKARGKSKTLDNVLDALARRFVRKMKKGDTPTK